MQRFQPARGLSFTGFVVWLCLAWTVCVLAAPGVRAFIRRRNERATLSKLENVRIRVKLYSLHFGGPPPKLDNLLLPRGGELLGTLRVYTAAHGYRSSVDAPDPFAEAPQDTGGWAYAASGPRAGTVYIMCTHADATGRAWSSY